MSRKSVFNWSKNLIAYRIGITKEGWYANLVEFGTKHSAPKPFMRPAFEARANQVVTRMREWMKRRIERLKI